MELARAVVPQRHLVRLVSEENGVLNSNTARRAKFIVPQAWWKPQLMSGSGRRTSGTREEDEPVHAAQVFKIKLFNHKGRKDKPRRTQTETNCVAQTCTSVHRRQVEIRALRPLLHVRDD